MNEIRCQPSQELFLSSSADIAIGGGSAGGGKTHALILEPLRHVSNSGFGAVFFRRSYPQVMGEGGFWEESHKIYPMLGAVSNKTDTIWRFPTGARIRARYLQHDKDVQEYQQDQIPLLLFDQLEQFSQYQFFYMLSRNRTTCGIRPYVRASCNPDADSWLAGFLSWWINQDTGYARDDRAGRIRYLIRIGDDLHWGNSKEELFEKHTDYFASMMTLAPDSKPEDFIKSVSFVPMSIFDNKALLEKDPAYLANLMLLPLVERERLLKGNWKIKHEAGKVFNRAWFEIVSAYPHSGIACRFWDFAATVKKTKGSDPDYTASVLKLKTQDGWFVLDCTNDRIANVDNMVVNLAKQDYNRLNSQGIRYVVRWEIEPGSAAKRESARLAKLLSGFNARGMRPQGDKVQRASASASQAEAGNVKVLAGPWNEEYLKQLHGFPDLPHDDIVDADSGSHNSLDQLGWVWRG